MDNGLTLMALQQVKNAQAKIAIMTVHNNRIKQLQNSLETLKNIQPSSFDCSRISSSNYICTGIDDDLRNQIRIEMCEKITPIIRSILEKHLMIQLEYLQQYIGE